MPMTPGEEIKRLRARIDDRERDVDDADADVLLEFSDELYLRREEYSDHRHLKLLRHATRMSEHGGSLSDAIVDEDACKDIVRWIHREYDNEETNRDYRVALRMCAKHATSGDDIPESVEWVSTKTSRNYNPTPDPTQMLRWENDIEPMLDGCRNPRDAAAIALQMDAGLRGGELYDLQLDDLHDSKHSLKVRADGKRGEHYVDLIPSIPYVNRWLDEHPGSGDDYLWTRLDRPERISYQRYLQMFREPAKRAGVDKKVTPTALRKSNASWLARMGANEALIEDRQGRVRGSEAVSRYVASFGEDDAESQYAAMHGLDVEVETADQRAPVTCPRCDKETPAEKDTCMWCDQALSPEVAAERKRERMRRLKSASMAEGEELEDVLRVEQALEDIDGVESVDISYAEE